MSVRTAFVVIALIVAGPSVVDAEPYDGPIPTTLDESPCVDRSDVVGYRDCPHYGTWADNLLGPYVFVEIGMNYRHFSSSNSADEPSPAARASMSTMTTMTTTPSSSTPSAHAHTFVERVGFGLTHHLYVALDFEFGNIDGPSSPARDMVLDGVVSAGLRGRLGPIALAGEAAGGGMTFPSNVKPQTEGMLEARGRAYVWIAPWCTISAVAGSSLLRGDWMAGLYIGYHSYAFGGDR